MARSATAPAFAPDEQPRVVIASDGTMAAIHEPQRIVVLELPGCAPFAEVGIDPDARASEVAWVGAPPRLLVLSRYEAHSTAHLLDPYGPRTIAEIRLETPMKLYAAVGSHALVVGQSAAVLTASDSHLTPYQFPARAVPSAAGPAGTQFVVALPTGIEEWDPQSRMPKRRLKLARPATIACIGGSDRVIWMTTKEEPARIDVVPLVNRGQPKQHDLAEPIAHIAGHPRSDMLVCVGGNTGRIYVVDLDGRHGPRIIGPEGIKRTETAGLVIGRMTGVLAAQTKHPVVVVSLDGAQIEDDKRSKPAAPKQPPQREPTEPDQEPVAEIKRAPTDDQIVEVPTTVQLASPPLAKTVEPMSGLGLATAAPTVAPKTSKKPRKPTALPVEPEAPKDAFTVWRERMAATPQRTQPPRKWVSTDPSWRDDLASWVAAIVEHDELGEVPTVESIDALITRFDLSPQLYPALALLYGVHLRGQGAAPIHLARVLGHRWDDALGRGELAEHGLAVYRESRIHLVPAVSRYLDELPPRTGTLVGTPGNVALLGPCVVVAPLGALAPVAEGCVGSVGGAILASHPHSDPRELYLEARTYGAAPMLRVTPSLLERIPTDEPAILVGSDDYVAEQLGVPRLK